MTNSFDIAIIGAASPVGEAVLEQLAERKFPLGALTPLAFDEDLDTTVSFANKQLHMQDIATFNFSNVQLVFLCQLDESHQAIVDRILDANCRVIEIGSNLQNAALVVAGVHHDDDRLQQSQHIRSASGLGVVLTQLLKPINDKWGIQSLHFTALQSVSDKGKPGIDELAMQTTSLLNTRAIKPSVFKQQIAFNVMADDSEINATGFTHRELDIRTELQDLLFAESDSKVSLMPSLLHVPVFYGVAVDVHLELKSDVDLHDFEQLIAQCENAELKFIDDIISPVSHAAELDKIFINRVRQDLGNSRQLNFWCVTDTIRSGSAINGVQIAEILVKHHL